jgi:hypothetical protein
MNKVVSWYKQTVMLPLVSKDNTDELKSFAITMSLAFPIIFMGILPFLFSAAVPKWPIYLSLLMTACYIFAPRLLYYPYLVWMHIASVFGFINTRVILALAYYLLIVPTGLVMKWRKGLQYKQFSRQESAWVKRDQLPKKNNLKEPF